MFLACAWENEKVKLIFLSVAYPIACKQFLRYSRLSNTDFPVG